MNNVVVRSLSGLLYIVIIVAAILAGPMWLGWLCILFYILGITEYTRMCCGKSLPRIALALDILTGGSLIFTFYSYSLSVAYTVTGVYLFLLFLILRLISQLYSSDSNAIASFGRSLTGLVYIALPLALMYVIYDLLGAATVLAMFIFIWVNDTGAFCTGMLLGRHKLFERISPKKTWEGFFGGVAFSLVAAFVLYNCFGSYFYGTHPAPVWVYYSIAILTPIAATFGDLIESQLKRTANVKDSGHLIPGHGGILDRIDSLLLVSPTVTLIAIIYMHFTLLDIL